MTEAKQVMESAYEWVNDFSGGCVSVLQRAFRRFGEADAVQAAAAMAYYAVFSLFPLLLMLISIASYFVESEQASQEVVGLVEGLIPVSQTLIQQNIQRVLDLRGTVGVVSLLGLLWSAGAFFTVLARNVNQAWPTADERTFVGRRLVGLTMIGVLLLLLILSLLSSAVLSILPRLQISIVGEVGLSQRITDQKTRVEAMCASQTESRHSQRVAEIHKSRSDLPDSSRTATTAANAHVALYDTVLWSVVLRIVPWFFTLLLFWALYRWVPNVEVERSTALGGAGVAAVAWELVKNGFVWYLNSGLIRYELVYGSLGAVVALMLWAYLGCLVTLFGAHLSSAIAAFQAQT